MERNKVIDIARGISILLVIIGHCEFLPLTIKIYIYSFHMPMFLFISGMCFSYKKYPKFKDFLKSKVKGLIVPYFSLGIVLINITRLYEFLSKGKEFGEFFNNDYWIQYLGLIAGYRLNRPYYSGYWFVSVLFVSLIIFYFIVKYVDKHPKKNIIYIIFIITSSVIGYAIIQFVKGAVWSLDIALISLAFIALGYLIKSNMEKLRNRIFKFDFIFILFAINAVATHFNYKLFGITDLFSCNVGNYFLYMLQSISGIWITMIICEKIGSSNLLEFFGKNTLIFYMFHYKVFFKIINDNLKHYKFSTNYKFIIEIVITCIAVSAVAYVINKFLPFLMGRSYKKRLKEVQNA